MAKQFRGWQRGDDPGEDRGLSLSLPVWKRNFQRCCSMSNFHESGRCSEACRDGSIDLRRKFELEACGVCGWPWIAANVECYRAMIGSQTCLIMPSALRSIARYVSTIASNTDFNSYGKILFGQFFFDFIFFSNSVSRIFSFWSTKWCYEEKFL